MKFALHFSEDCVCYSCVYSLKMKEGGPIITVIRVRQVLRMSITMSCQLVIHPSEKWVTCSAPPTHLVCHH